MLQPKLIITFKQCELKAGMFNAHKGENKYYQIKIRALTFDPFEWNIIHSPFWNVLFDTFPMTYLITL